MIIFPPFDHYFRKRRLGFVAEYCPRCCETHAVQFLEIVRYLTIFCIPLPPGAVVGHEIHCDKCRSQYSVDLNRYTQPVKQDKLPIEHLIQLTHPDLWDELESRELLKNRVMDGSAAPDEKVAALTEIIGAYEGDAAKRADEINIEGWGTFTFILMFLLPLMTFIADARYQWPIGLLGELVIAQEAVLLPLLIYFVATDARRYCHCRLLPQMLSALHDYRPTDKEIGTALSNLNHHGYIISRKLDFNRIVEDLHKFSKSKGSDR